MQIVLNKEELAEIRDQIHKGLRAFSDHGVYSWSKYEIEEDLKKLENVPGIELTGSIQEMVEALQKLEELLNI